MATLCALPLPENNMNLHKPIISRGLFVVSLYELLCFVVAALDDKDNTRVINMTSVFKAFGRVPRSNNRLINIPAFIDAKNLQPYINQEVMSLIKPVEYSNGKTCH